MDVHDIKAIFKNRKSKPLEIKQYFSVLLPLINRNGQLHILYEVRSDKVTQPGEISFPGGRVEVCENFKDAAIRETHEEIGVDRQKIEVFGELDYITRENNFILYPYVGVLHETFDNLRISEDEVAKVFTVPLDFFLETKPDVYEISYKTNFTNGFPYDKIPNGENYKWREVGRPVLFYDYQGHIIWGMTARITHNFVKRIIKGDKNEPSTQASMD
jgi:8-oxo-dGTP pyrophosphatase MutT (NUDIX family)